MQKALFLLAVVLAACGGDDTGGSSGVDSTKTVKSLTPAEITAECHWDIAISGGAGKMTTCSGGATLTVHTQAECEASLMALPTSCTLTVAQLEACTEAEASDPCGALEAQACAPVLACAQ